MSLFLTSPPAAEPVSLAEAKAHLRVDTSAEDLLIGALITTSRLQIEAALSLALVTQSWSWFRDDWPDAAPLALPIGPVQNLVAVRVYDTADAATVLPLAAFKLAPGVQARIARAALTGWPSALRPLNGIEIAFTAGFGPAPTDVPAPIRHALLMLVAHWFEHRDAVEIGSPAARVPVAVSALLQPWQRPRLQ